MAQYRPSKGDTDVKAMFQTQTIDQLWVTLTDKRREGEIMQQRLRQLVGDRYKDLLSASDMIAGMGDICDCLIETFQETQAARSDPSAKTDTDFHLTAQTDPRYASKQLHAATGQIRAWVEDSRYLDASLAALQLKERLEYLTELNKRHGRADNYHSLQALRVRKMLKQLPEDLIRHTVRSLVSSPGVTSSITLSSQCVYSLSLLHDAPIIESLQRFIEYQTRTLKAPLQKGWTVTEETASVAVSTLFSIRAFLYKVFIERSYALNDALTLVGVSTVPASMVSNRSIMELADCIPASEYLDAQRLESFSAEHPSVSDAKELLQKWQDEAAPIAIEILASSLSGLATTAEVVQIKATLDTLVAGFSNEAIHAQPPSAWSDSIGVAITNRLLAILDTELNDFIEETKASLEKYTAEEDASARLFDTPLIDEAVVSQRYRCGGVSEVSGFDMRRCEAVLDPSLSSRAKGVIGGFFDGFAKVLDSLCTVCSNSASPAEGEERVAALLQNILTDVATTVAASAHTFCNPTMGLLVQGLARTVSHATASFRRSPTWVTTALLRPFHDAMHATYLSTFDLWVEECSARLESAISLALVEEYWGPDRAVYEKIVWASWEHREEDVGDEGAIASNLPGAPTAAVLKALQQSAAGISEVVPSLLRKAVIQKLHKQVAKRVFPLYKELLEGSVCQPALWQVLLDVKLIGVVCGVSEHGSAQYDEVLEILLRSEKGIDPVYWSTEKEAFEQLFASCVDGVHLLLACHGVHKTAATEVKATREACYVDFVSECDRFPTLHLAPLAPQSQSAFSGDFQQPLASKSTTAQDSTSGAPLSGLQGLQHLQALGTGLQQQWKGMKYFNWA